MDTYRALLAVVISFVILLGYQYFFVGFDAAKPAAPVAEVAPASVPAPQTASSSPVSPVSPGAAPTQALPAPTAPVSAERPARNISVDTSLYQAVLSENGGAITSFILKDYKETPAKDATGMQLIKTSAQEGFPLTFSWGGGVPANLLYTSTTDKVQLTDSATSATLTMKAVSEFGLEVERTYRFNRDTYLLELLVRVKNTSSAPLQGAPVLHQVNLPFDQGANGSMTALFTGPAVFMDNQRQEFTGKEIGGTTKTVQGKVDWAAYDSTYFMCAILPDKQEGVSVTMQQADKLVNMGVSGSSETLQPGEEKVYHYHTYFGPKKLSLLQQTGYNLDKAVNFGWFDVMAKPTLWLLNFFNTFVKNYGVAIILVTIAFKLAFWPIAQKGLLSMKNMQKLQPKMVKLKEKYKDDPAMMNKEVMNLYKTYKVNPWAAACPCCSRFRSFLLCIRCS